MTRSILASDLPSTVSPVVPGVMAPSFLYNLAYERRSMSGLESCRYPSSSGSLRLPRSWIMFRIVSAVRLSRTCASFPSETCLTSPLGFFLSSVPAWTAFPSSDYYGGSVTLGLSPLRQSRASLSLYVVAWFSVAFSSRYETSLFPVLPLEVRVPTFLWVSRHSACRS